MEIRNELVTVKRALNGANSLEQIIPVAKGIRALIPVRNEELFGLIYLRST